MQAKISFVMWQHPIHIHLTQTIYSVQISLLHYCNTILNDWPITSTYGRLFEKTIEKRPALSTDLSYI